MSDKLKNTIYALLTENTGIHFLDSGGDSGRAWQRNANKTMADFESEAPAYLDISSGVYNGLKSYDFIVGVSLYHKLNACLRLTKLCNTFNALPVDDWRGGYYGVSEAGENWLNDNGFIESRNYFKGGFNSYNFDSNLSQDIQGHILENNGDFYVLLQIHGGADIRGGYTDAKLFKFVEFCEPYALFDNYCFFDINGVSLDYRDGDGFTDPIEGAPYDQDQLNALGKAAGDCLINGFFNTDY